MGRRQGVTAEQTRHDLLRAAAAVFARRGYDGATIGEIAREAGLTSGAIYVHYDGKAELFSAVLESYARRELVRHLHDDHPFDIGDYITEVGADLDRRPMAERTLLIEAVMAAKHDPKVRAVLSRWFSDQHQFFAESLGAAQKSGLVDDGFEPMAAARFSTMVMLGSMVLDVLDVPGVSHEDWADFITQVVDGFRPDRRAALRQETAGPPGHVPPVT